MERIVRINSEISKSTSRNAAYNAGYEAGRYGANEDNCHFSIFCTEKGKKAWAKGNADGKRDKEQL